MKQQQGWGIRAALAAYIPGLRSETWGTRHPASKSVRNEGQENVSEELSLFNRLVDELITHSHKLVTLIFGGDWGTYVTELRRKALVFTTLFREQLHRFWGNFVRL
jgi:hypothetical protein